MKKVIFVCIAFFIALSLHAQSDSERMGDTAFSMGNYYDAMELYDAAITLSKDRASEIQKKRSKASNCFSLKKAGDSFFASEAYEDAQSKYQQLLSLNPSDKSAKERLSKLGSLIAESKALIAANQAKEAKIQELQQTDKAYYDALKSGVEALKEFCLKYPDSEQIHKAEIVINALKQGEFYGISTEISLYNQIGNDFKKIGDVGKARKFYDYSSSFADPEGLYLKALTYDDVTTVRPRNLLVLSSAGGYALASDKLISVIGGNKYDTNVAQTRYKHLRNYRTELESFVYIYENRLFYPIDELQLEVYGQEHFRRIINANQISYDDNLIYQFAEIAQTLKIDSELLYKYVASQGNIDALRKVYEMKKSSLKYEDRQAFEDFLTGYYKSNYKSYLKYLRGEEMTSGDWACVCIYGYDRHEDLLSMSFSMTSNYELEYFKKHIARKNDNSLWDKEIIELVKQKASYYSPKYAEKIIKSVSKLKTVDGVYDITANPIYKFIKTGFCDSLHIYIQPIRRDVLWLTSAVPADKSARISAVSSTQRAPSKDAKIINYIRQRGGKIVIESKSTAISNSGSTTFTIQAVTDNSISIGVLGDTGITTFSNPVIVLSLKDGKATASKQELQRCNYVYFSASFSLTDNELEIYIRYTSTAASYSTYKKIPLESSKTTSKLTKSVINK